MKPARNVLILAACIAFSHAGHCQLSKLKQMVGGKKDTTAQSSTTKQKGPGLMTKLVTKIAKSTGGMMGVSSTADLSAVVPNVFLSTNLCPYEVGTADMAFYENWKPGGNSVVIMFTNRNGAGLNKLDGTVTINGVAADYVSSGVYVAFANDNSAAKKIEIATSTGNRSSFTLAPPKHRIKLKSVNGKKENIQLDLTKDVTLEVENPPGLEKTKVLVKLVAKTVGIKAFYDVGYFDTAEKIIIPAAAFRNLNMSPGNKSFMNFKESFLMVERSYVDEAMAEEGTFSNLKFANIYNDGKFISVTNEPVLNVGITVEGTTKASSGEIAYSAFKPNAFLSRCMGNVNVIGVKSFAIRGTTYVAKSTTENRTGADGSVEKTRTTLTAQFPQMSNEVWDNVLTDFYTGIIPMLNSELKTETAPIETVTATNSYLQISPYSKDDENTSVEFSRAYKTTKLFSAFLPISEGYGINNADTRIMEESKTNALLNVTIDLQLSIEGNNTVMKPLLGITLQGEANGFAAATRYFALTITGASYKLKKNQTITSEVLQNILQREDLLKTLRQSLQELNTIELENKDYATLWSCN